MQWRWSAGVHGGARPLLILGALGEPLGLTHAAAPWSTTTWVVAGGGARWRQFAVWRHYPDRC